MRARLLVVSALTATASGCSALLGLDDAVVEPPNETVTPAPPSASLADTGAPPDTSTIEDVADVGEIADAESDAKPDAKESD